MSLSFGQVVSCNNILALKAFTTFLANYRIHYKPNFFERMAINSAEKWIELRARKELIELRNTELEKINLRLNDTPTALFTVLYLAGQRDMTFGSGKELFEAISNTELEFEKIKKPRVEAVYGQDFGSDSSKS